MHVPKFNAITLRLHDIKIQYKTEQCVVERHAADDRKHKITTDYQYTLHTKPQHSTMDCIQIISTILPERRHRQSAHDAY